MITFEQLGLSKQALASLEEVGFTEPTEIQGRTIGIVAARKDLIASAQTGSGKTAAYALPILDIIRSADNFSADEPKGRTNASKSKTKALVIVPTRELALQVRDEFTRFGTASGIRAVALFGGTGYRSQVQALHRGADVIVATPGRLLDCLNRNFATLSKVQVVVLDEADRLLDMGFMPQVRAVIAKAPEERQTVMFSATIDARMKKIAEEFLTNPEVVAVNQQKIEPSSIEQQFHYIKEAAKETKLTEILQTVDGGSVLVFTKTRKKAGLVTSKLKSLDVLAEEIHGDISQAQRVRTLTRFRNGEFNVLVATDVAARGLDIPAISHVINYDLPMAAEDYVHRIGRTGRAGKSGIAHSFVSNDQRYLVNGIHRVLKNTGNQENGGDGSELNDEAFIQRRSQEAVAYVQRIGGGGRGRSGGYGGAGYGRGGSNGGAGYGRGGSNGGAYTRGANQYDRKSDMHRSPRQRPAYGNSESQGTQGSEKPRENRAWDLDGSSRGRDRQFANNSQRRGDEQRYSQGAGRPKQDGSKSYQGEGSYKGERSYQGERSQQSERSYRGGERSYQGERSQQGERSYRGGERSYQFKPGMDAKQSGTKKPTDGSSLIRRALEEAEHTVYSYKREQKKTEYSSPGHRHASSKTRKGTAGKVTGRGSWKAKVSSQSSSHGKRKSRSH